MLSVSFLSLEAWLPSHRIGRTDILMILSALQALGLLALTLLVLSILYQVIYNHFFHPLSSYPGPFFAGVTRIWIAWHNYFEVETKVCWDLVQRHGARFVIFISDHLGFKLI